MAANNKASPPPNPTQKQTNKQLKHLRNIKVHSFYPKKKVIVGMLVIARTLALNPKAKTSLEHSKRQNISRTPKKQRLPNIFVPYETSFKEGNNKVTKFQTLTKTRRCRQTVESCPQIASLSPPPKDTLQGPKRKRRRGVLPPPPRRRPPDRVKKEGKATGKRCSVTEKLLT